MEKIIQKIIENIDVKYGQDFFEEITLQLDRVINSDFTFIARLNLQKHSSETIALVANGQLVDNMEYSLAGTPCDEVAGDSVCIYPRNVAEHFPEDLLLVDMGIEGYLGTPLYDSQGNVMGIVVALYKSEVQQQNWTLSLFKLFSSRIASEFERLDREQQLIELNSTLDEKVQERTAQLEETLQKLRDTQLKLIENEKMSALGSLVAGVAHEVNTPLGIAITASSIINDSLVLLSSSLANEKLTKTMLNQQISTQSDAMPMLVSNLQRAKSLIDNFKSMASDQSDISAEVIALAQYYKKLVLTLNSVLKKKAVSVEVLCDGDDVINTLPGYHAQLITNLIANSIEHGFNGNNNNKIVISITRKNKQQLRVSYQDNGKGINVCDFEKVLEPFFTTSRHLGSTGLGLSIVYNIVVQQLKGDFKLIESDKGISIEYLVTACPVE